MLLGKSKNTTIYRASLKKPGAFGNKGWISIYCIEITFRKLTTETIISAHEKYVLIHLSHYTSFLVYFLNENINTFAKSQGRRICH